MAEQKEAAAKAAAAKAAADKAAADKAAADKAAADKAAADKAAANKAAADKAAAKEKAARPKREQQGNENAGGDDENRDLTESQRERVDAMVQRVLSRYDSNENGKLDKREIRALEGRVDFINRADLDSNGVITATELNKTIADSMRSFRNR